MTQRGREQTLTANICRSYIYPKKTVLTCYVSSKKFKIGDRVRVTVELLARTRKG